LNDFNEEEDKLGEVGNNIANSNEERVSVEDDKEDRYQKEEDVQQPKSFEVLLCGNELIVNDLLNSILFIEGHILFF